jgi:hypothetical protein
MCRLPAARGVFLWKHWRPAGTWGAACPPPDGREFAKVPTSAPVWKLLEIGSRVVPDECLGDRGGQGIKSFPPRLPSLEVLPKYRHSTNDLTSISLPALTWLPHTRPEPEGAVAAGPGGAQAAQEAQIWCPTALKLTRACANEKARLVLSWEELLF